MGLIWEPVRVETQFGCVLNDPFFCLDGKSYRVYFASCISVHKMLKIDYSNIDTIDNFWNLETIGVKENELSDHEK